MDSLKSLLDKKQYDLILSLSEGSNDPETLVYRISAYLGKGDAANASALFFAHRDELWENNPMLTLKSNFELRFITKQFDEAYDDIPYFQNKPYVSQEVEEYLRSLPKLIRMNEKNDELIDDYSPERIHEILKESPDDYTVLNLLNYLQNLPLQDYLSDVKALLWGKRHPSVKTYALLILVEAGYPDEVLFSKNGKNYHLVPQNLVPPYTGPLFDGFVRYLRGLVNDPSLSGVAVSLLNDYILDVYPETVLREKEDPLLAFAFLLLAKNYLRSPFALEELYGIYGVDPKAVEARSKEIASTLKKEPPLSI